MRSAVIVAHPDDETLWAGCLIGQKPGIDVICCSVPRRDPERSIRFFEAVRILGGFPILIAHIEPPPDEDMQHLHLLDLSPYDTVYTHNAQGEYGHRHHKNVHQYVVESGVRRVFGFGGDFLVTDPTDRKLAALKCYDHQSPSDNGKPKWKALLDRYDINLHADKIHAIRAD